MSTISEQEAREAARHLESARKKYHQLKDDECDTRWVERDMDNYRWRLACFAVQELSRRDAERAEREKPITAEWLESIGFDVSDVWISTPFPGGKVFVGRGKLGVYVNVTYLSRITTRGQLLDLLAALKGGDS